MVEGNKDLNAVADKVVNYNVSIQEKTLEKKKEKIEKEQKEQQELSEKLE